MKYNYLGKTGIKVSKLCFGGLTIGPLQANLFPAQGGRIIARAMELGVNFIDTADLYGTYPHIRKALEYNNKELIIASKSYDYERKGAQKSFNKALTQINRDYIDIFMLHEQESLWTIKGHWEAMEYFLEQKKKGYIRAVGISTHRVECVLAASDIPEIDVIHPIININGVGIDDGDRGDMEKAISYAKKKDKGIYGMKPLGGGNLLNNIKNCFDYVLNLDILDSIAVGMQSEEEVLYNIKRFNGEDIPQWISQKLRKQPRKLLIDFWCEACGICEEKCTHGAIKVIDGKARVDREKCVLCGYCGAYCPQFCIKVI